jgi:hypothetical protein
MTLHELHRSFSVEIGESVTVNNELDLIGKEATMMCFKIHSRIHPAEVG